MDRSQFSVSWEAHQKSICNGLSALQQKGEFVDMTLAADGHHVKVHKMVMALVSPYIKELINTADCPHPVIFLNQMSYKTLCYILEYVYTGEVLIPRDIIDEFVAAGKALHIKGLINMHLTTCLPREAGFIQVHNSETKTSTKITESKENNVTRKRGTKAPRKEKIQEIYIDENTTVDTTLDSSVDDVLDDDVVMEETEMTAKSPKEQEPTPPPLTQPQHSMPELELSPAVLENPPDPAKTPYMQYSVSNQGNLQMVLNRYLYYLVYTGRNSGHRRWQCIDNHMKRLRCPAAVITKNGVIVQRISAHNHPFHDEKIIKKVQSSLIFSGLRQAQHAGKLLQDSRIPTTSNVKNGDSDNK